jgi:hypothetical protein
MGMARMEGMVVGDEEDAMANDLIPEQGAGKKIAKCWMCRVLYTM